MSKKGVLGRYVTMTSYAINLHMSKPQISRERNKILILDFGDSVV